MQRSLAGRWATSWNRIMNDPFAWSFPFGRLFGINIRIHVLFPVFAAAMIMRVGFDKHAASGAWIDMTVLMGFAFFCVLLHEFGHCFGARMVGGEARQVLLWPLGGLAGVEVPHRPGAHFVTTICGPLVNVILATAAAVALALVGGVKPNFLLEGIGRNNDQIVVMHLWDGDFGEFAPLSGPVLLQFLFLVNYLQALFNLVLIGFPMDGGRIFQCIMWRYVGYRRATLAAIYAGFVTMFALGVYSIVANEVLMICLALFIYYSCQQEWLRLESSGDESFLGYDFSQGYTSLERGEPAAPPTPPKPKLSWWQRWRKKRAERRAQQEEERRIADESRLDELLDKVQREGKGALTDEELRFMQRVSDRYRNQRKS